MPSMGRLLARTQGSVSLLALVVAVGVGLLAAGPALAADAAPPAPAPAPQTAAEPAAESDPAPLPGAFTRPLELVPESLPVVTPPPGVLRRLPGICGRDACLPTFLRDSDLRLHLRTFYFDRNNPDESENEAWALGGWLSYTSGWLADIFQVGAVAYTSQPLYAPEEYDGTSLLAPGQQGIQALGQAYGRLRYQDYAVLTGYRQSVDSGYIGPQDNRMIPNAFEGVTLRGKVCDLSYNGGYLWSMKPRNRDHFIPMSEQAGVKDGEDGVWYGAVNWTPTKAWEVFAGDYYTPDAFNTAFAYGKFTFPVAACVEGQAGAQYTDQRSVGEEDLGGFETWNAGLGARLVWAWGLTVGAAFHATGEDANIRSSYGSWPGYLSLIEIDFDRANEKALGVGVKYDFGKSRRLLYAPGVLLSLGYAYGFDREDPTTGAGVRDTSEFDIDLTYNVPAVKGLQLRFRNAYVDSGGEQTGYQFRLIVNWEVDLW